MKVKYWLLITFIESRYGNKTIYNLYGSYEKLQAYIKHLDSLQQEQSYTHTIELIYLHK